MSHKVKNAKIKGLLIYILHPRALLFFVAIFNFVWFFSQSSSVYNFSSEGKISFCAGCPWYWYWSLTNLPSLSLLAVITMFFARWKGYLAACIISGYQITDGINWLSRGSGFLGGLSQRLDVISESNSTNIWELLDVQYFLAIVIFITALAYLIKEFARPKKVPSTSFP